MTDIAIRIEKLNKQYRIGAAQAPYDTLRDQSVAAARSPFRGVNGRQESQTVWALKDASFEVKRGEVVGIPSTSSGQASVATGRGRARC